MNIISACQYQVKWYNFTVCLGLKVQIYYICDDWVKLNILCLDLIYFVRGCYITKT